MAFDLGGAVEGGSQGAAISGGNPFVTAGMAALGAFTKGKKNNKASSPSTPSTPSGGFDPKMILDVLNSFTGGQEQQVDNGPKIANPAAGMQSITPPPLLGFPSMTGPKVGELLARTMQARRGGI